MSLDQKSIASPGSMHETGYSGLVHWDDPEGWDGEGGGGRFRMGNTCTPMADSCQYMAKPLQYCKVISLQLKYKEKPKHKTEAVLLTNSRMTLKMVHIKKK